MLAKEYEGKLLELEVNLNEDQKMPNSARSRKMVVVIGEKKQVPIAHEGSVEEINIAVRREDKVVISRPKEKRSKRSRPIVKQRSLWQHTWPVIFCLRRSK